MNKDKCKTYNDFYDYIDDYIFHHPLGEHTHKIIGFKLLECSKILSVDDANRIIDELDITENYGIYKVEK